jgi:hypothetical protein
VVNSGYAKQGIIEAPPGYPPTVNAYHSSLKVSRSFQRGFDLNRLPGSVFETTLSRKDQRVDRTEQIIEYANAISVSPYRGSIQESSELPTDTRQR